MMLILYLTSLTAGKPAFVMCKEAGLLKITIAIFFIVGITTAYKGKPAATVSSPSIAMTLRDEMP